MSDALTPAQLPDRFKQDRVKHVSHMFYPAEALPRTDERLTPVPYITREGGQHFWNGNPRLPMVKGFYENALELETALVLKKGQKLYADSDGNVVIAENAKKNPELRQNTGITLLYLAIT
jgi:hypothetical protein